MPGHYTLGVPARPPARARTSPEGALCLATLHLCERPFARLPAVIAAAARRLYRDGRRLADPRTGGAVLDKGLKARLGTVQPRDVCAGWRDPDCGAVGVKNIIIAELRPTQATVGLREVMAKRRRYRAALAAGCSVLLQRQGVPIVIGPQGHAYVLDRHHAVCALLAEGVVAVRVVPLDDLSRLSPEAFWSTLNARGWCHPYDADGRLLPYHQIPTSLSKLADDPYRSLASALRRSGGFDKVKFPYSEFAWADFLRRRLDHRALERDFDGALQAALRLSGSEAARVLPGWRAGRLSRMTSDRPKAPSLEASKLRRGAPRQSAGLLG
jgi:hypothetical protein